VLRAGADADHDGLLDKDEAEALKARLQAMALNTLKVGVSSEAIALEAQKAKLSLREDYRAEDAGLSVAVMVHAKLPYTLTQGLKVEVQDVSPDGSASALDVFQAPAEKAKGEAPFHGVVPPGQVVKVRLGALGDIPESDGGPQAPKRP